MASHDGRFSYACLRLGASHVTGIEGRPHLVKFANENLASLGCGLQTFRFINSDVFDYMANVKSGEFDTILCFGFFYHTIRQIDLIEEIKRIKPKYFILDTMVAPELPKLFHIIRLRTRIRFRHLMGIKKSLKKLEIWHGGGYLLFEHEDHTEEGATIEPTNLIACPTKSLVETLFKSYGFTFKQLHWNKKDVKTWIGLDDYKTGQRVSYISQLL